MKASVEMLYFTNKVVYVVFQVEFEFPPQPTLNPTFLGGEDPQRVGRMMLLNFDPFLYGETGTLDLKESDI